METGTRKKMSSESREQQTFRSWKHGTLNATRIAFPGQCMEAATAVRDEAPHTLADKEGAAAAGSSSHSAAWA